MITEPKPGSPTELVEHAGVKGMKWGVRKTVDRSIGTKTAGKKPSSKKKSTTKKPLTKKQKQARNEKRAETVGQAAVAAILVAHGVRSIRSNSASQKLESNIRINQILADQSRHSLARQREIDNMRRSHERSMQVGRDNLNRNLEKMQRENRAKLKNRQFGFG